MTAALSVLMFGSSEKQTVLSVPQRQFDDVPRLISPPQVESAGTVLSTNWKDVGKRKVDMSPPEDVEFKKY